VSYLHIADETVGLPAPANIPTPRSRAALEKAISTANGLHLRQATGQTRARAPSPLLGRLPSRRRKT
jgi:hypothetical protein